MFSQLSGISFSQCFKSIRSVILFMIAQCNGYYALLGTSISDILVIFFFKFLNIMKMGNRLLTV